MAKFLIVLAAALLQVSAGPFNPFNMMFDMPKMGLNIASQTLGTVSDSMEKNNLGFVSGPLKMVQSGLDMPVSMLDKVQAQMPAFEMPSFGGSSGFLSGLTGGSEGKNMFSNMFAMPEKMIASATDMFGQSGKGGMFGGVTDMFSGFSGQAKSSMEKLQAAITEAQTATGASQEQLMTLMKESTGKAQEAAAGLQGKVDAAKKQVTDKVGEVQKQVTGKVAEAQKQATAKVAEVQKQATDKVAEVQKKIQEELAKVQAIQKEVAPKAEAMISTIMADLQKQAAAAQTLGDNESVQAIKGQMEKVVSHANELMTKMQSSKTAESATQIAKQFAEDFKPLLEKKH